MLRRLFNLMAAVFISTAMTTPAQAKCGSNSIGRTGAGAVILDRPVPWPWGLERPFPWTGVQGIWKISDEDYSAYFVMKVVRSKDSGQRLLIVRQIDPETCNIMASGVGYENESDRTVRAQMTNDEGVPYRLAIRAFAKTDLPASLIAKDDDAQVMVLSIANVDASDTAQVHFKIGKVTGSIDLDKCAAQKSGNF